MTLILYLYLILNLTPNHKESDDEDKSGMKRPLERKSSGNSSFKPSSSYHHGLPDGDLPAWNTQNSSWDVGCPSGLSSHPLPIPAGNVTAIFRNASLHRRRHGVAKHEPASAKRPLDSIPPISHIGLGSVANDMASSSPFCWPGDCLEDLGDGSLVHVGGEEMASLYQVSYSRSGEESGGRESSWECNLRFSNVGGTISQLCRLPCANHPHILLARCGNACAVVKDWIAVQKLEFRNPLVHVCPGIVSTAGIEETLGIHDWDVETGTVNQNLGTNSGFRTCAWSLHPRELWVVEKSGNCSLWDLRQRFCSGRRHLDPLPFSRTGAVLRRPECYAVLQHPKDPRGTYVYNVVMM